MVSFLSVRTPRAAPTNPLMVRRIAAFSGSRKRISDSSRSLRLSPLLEGGKRGERRYLNELLRIVNKRAILTLVVMTFLPFPSSLSLVKKSIENFLSLRGEGKNETRRVQWIARREKEKEEDEEDGSVLFPYHPKKSGRSKAPPRLFVLQEIKYEAIKLPVNREPRRRLRRPLLFFCASNLGASRKGQIMASL